MLLQQSFCKNTIPGWMIYNIIIILLISSSPQSSASKNWRYSISELHFGWIPHTQRDHLFLFHKLSLSEMISRFSTTGRNRTQVNLSSQTWCLNYTLTTCEWKLNYDFNFFMNWSWLCFKTSSQCAEKYWSNLFLFFLCFLFGYLNDLQSINEMFVTQAQLY